MGGGSGCVTRVDACFQRVIAATTSENKHDGTHREKENGALHTSSLRQKAGQVSN